MGSRVESCNISPQEKMVEMGGSYPDWIDGKNARVLKVNNEREKYQLQKTTQALDHMNVLNERFRRMEKEKVERNLGKLKAISNQKILNNRQRLPEKVAQTKLPEDQPVSVKLSSGAVNSQFGDHLPKFASFLQNPTKRIGQSTLKSSVPFSRLSLPNNMSASKSINSPNKNLNSVPGSVNFSKLNEYSTSYSRSSQIPSNFGSRGTITSIPSLSKVFSAGGNKHMTDSHEALFGFITLDKKLNEVLSRITHEKIKAPSTGTETLKPEEVLRCRYLRLSRNNISTLLKQCEESGFQVDIHPHMKESEVNVDGVFTRSYSSDTL
ncbi:uncharacterized protein C16orf78-like isoform X2 [Narcine bancroftii]|uniref:uncharacterized protein C16orf78-like isoform X2 n=1 Tax=Narcine bancroftii TaxID=1343680 RepID=UPI0038319AFD